MDGRAIAWSFVFLVAAATLLPFGLAPFVVCQESGVCSFPSEAVEAVGPSLAFIGIVAGSAMLLVGLSW